MTTAVIGRRVLDVRFPAQQTGVAFADVKKVLDDMMKAWSAKRNNRPPDLEAHGPTLKWDTAADLLAAVAFDKRLIQPELIGNGRANETNLVLVLTTNKLGRRMPLGGPYLSDAQVKVIVDWINGGAKA